MNKNCKLMMGAMLALASFSYGKAAFATSCAIPPTCEQLGYTMKVDECGESPILRCPFALSDNNKVFCGGTTENANQVVSIGAIVYGDGTVASGVVTGKTPIGVVFDTANRLAVALTDVKKDGTAGSEYMYWSNSYYDIPSLPNCQYSDGDVAVDSCSPDGRSNTTLILACGSGCGGTPAATAANSYQPSGCTKDFCKKTKWFLPSMRDLASIYALKAQVNASLTLLSGSGAKTLTENYYWSSTEYDYTSAWVFGMSNGSRYYHGKTNLRYVRPVLAF